MSPVTLFQIALVPLVLVGTALYAYGRRHGDSRLSQIVLGVLAVYAAAHIVFMVFLWFNHGAFPFNLEAMELTVVAHVRRIMEGCLLYIDPSPEFAPLAYNPLYYYLVVPFAWLFGANLSTLRLVAAVGMGGACLMIYLIVQRHTRSPWWGLMAAGLFAAAYRVMDSYLDNAHSDSWLLFTILLGCCLIDRSPKRWQNLIGVLLLVMAFWFKQHGALFVIGGVLFLTWRDGWRTAWPYWVTAVLLGPGLYIVMPASLLGSRFHYYTLDVPRQWSELTFGTVARLAQYIARNYFVLAILSIGGAGAAFLRPRRRLNIWYALVPAALLSAFMGALDVGSNNNVFILMCVWLIVTGLMALHQLLDRFTVLDRWGAPVAAIGMSFVLLIYQPVSVIVTPSSYAAYRDLVNYVQALDGPVYAPWIGPLQAEYQFSPTIHWVALQDMIRGPGRDERNHPLVRNLLAEVAQPPAGKAYLLLTTRLEEDDMLCFLADNYVLEADLGDRFTALNNLPKRYAIGGPVYLYQYAPGHGAGCAPR